MASSFDSLQPKVRFLGHHVELYFVNTWQDHNYMLQVVYNLSSFSRHSKQEDLLRFHTPVS